MRMLDGIAQRLKSLHHRKSSLSKQEGPRKFDAINIERYTRRELPRNSVVPSRPPWNTLTLTRPRMTELPEISCGARHAQF